MLKEATVALLGASLILGAAESSKAAQMTTGSTSGSNGSISDPANPNFDGAAPIASTGNGADTDTSYVAQDPSNADTDTSTNALIANANGLNIDSPEASGSNIIGASADSPSEQEGLATVVSADASAESIPEPMTVLGTMAALGVGAAIRKRRQQLAESRSA